MSLFFRPAAINSSSVNDPVPGAIVGIFNEAAAAQGGELGFYIFESLAPTRADQERFTITDQIDPSRH